MNKNLSRKELRQLAVDYTRSTDPDRAWLGSQLLIEIGVNDHNATEIEKIENALGLSINYLKLISNPGLVQESRERLYKEVLGYIAKIKAGVNFLWENEKPQIQLNESGGSVAFGEGGSGSLSNYRSFSGNNEPCNETMAEAE